ncbi:MAG: class I SAM-dependent methyltransferase [Acidimicrobiia bacterium]
MDAARWDERYDASDRLWSATPNIFVEDRLKDREPGRGLDVAAGEGRNAVWLSSLGWKMTAVDFSSVALARGAEQDDQVVWVEADVREWEPSSGFDLVLVAYLHLVPPVFQEVVSHAATWLDPGGELFLVGHDRTNIEHGWGGPQHPDVLWDGDEIVSRLDGLAVVESIVARRPVETDHGTEYARDTLVRARRPG